MVFRFSVFFSLFFRFAFQYEVQVVNILTWKSSFQKIIQVAESFVANTAPSSSSSRSSHNEKKKTAITGTEWVEEWNGFIVWLKTFQLASGKYSYALSIDLCNLSGSLFHLTFPNWIDDFHLDSFRFFPHREQRTVCTPSATNFFFFKYFLVQTNEE